MFQVQEYMNPLARSGHSWLCSERILTSYDRIPMQSVDCPVIEQSLRKIPNTPQQHRHVALSGPSHG
jgi:hypothetical protein